MKIVCASTEEQELKLQELVSYMYSSVFPRYFCDREISEYDAMKILHLPEEKDNRLFTLDTAFQAISSLQVIIAILEILPHQKQDKQEEQLFNKNVKMLEQTGLSFPFNFANFTCKNISDADAICSMYAEPMNEILI
nr:DUF5365 family protein [Paenibacillus bovis]